MKAIKTTRAVLIAIAAIALTSSVLPLSAVARGGGGGFHGGGGGGGFARGSGFARGEGFSEYNPVSEGAGGVATGQGFAGGSTDGRNYREQGWRRDSGWGYGWGSYGAGYAYDDPAESEYEATHYYDGALRPSGGGAYKPAPAPQQPKVSETELLQAADQTYSWGPDKTSTRATTTATKTTKK